MNTRCQLREIIQINTNCKLREITAHHQLGTVPFQPLVFLCLTDRLPSKRHEIPNGNKHWNQSCPLVRAVAFLNKHTQAEVRWENIGLLIRIGLLPVSHHCIWDEYLSRALTTCWKRWWVCHILKTYFQYTRHTLAAKIIYDIHLF